MAPNDSLQAVDLSRRLQTVVQILSKPPVPINGGPIYVLVHLAMRTIWMAGSAPHKSG